MKRIPFGVAVKALAAALSAWAVTTLLSAACTPYGQDTGPESAPTATSANRAVGTDHLPDPPASSVLHTDVLSVTDADRPAEVWYLLDQTQHKVHRIGLTGEHLGSFVMLGEGPGEFRQPQPLAVWVLAVWEDLRGTRLEVYEVS